MIARRTAFRCTMLRELAASPLTPFYEPPLCEGRLVVDRAIRLDFSMRRGGLCPPRLSRNDRAWKPTDCISIFCCFTAIFSPFCHFDQSVVFSLALAQNRGFCAKEERQRSEVARRVYAACLERSLPRRARGEISERQRRTKAVRLIDENTMQRAQNCARCI